jgi:hypothetical protein
MLHVVSTQHGTEMSRLRRERFEFDGARMQVWQTGET